jgi:hypothetical protein
MIIVQYTQAKTLKGETVNIYKSKEFLELSTATDFQNKMQAQKNVTDVRVFSK